MTSPVASSPGLTNWIADALEDANVTVHRDFRRTVGRLLVIRDEDGARFEVTVRVANDAARK